MLIYLNEVDLGTNFLPKISADVSSFAALRRSLALATLQMRMEAGATSFPDTISRPSFSETLRYRLELQPVTNRLPMGKSENTKVCFFIH